MKLLSVTSKAKARLSRLIGCLNEFVCKRAAFCGAVLLPVILAGAYLAFLSADRWVSESKITVKSASVGDSVAPGMLSLLTGGPSMREDVLFLKEFILSQDMFEHLDRTVGIRSMYGKSGVDIFMHLGQSASSEDALSYFRSRVELTYDEISGVLTVATQGFTPEDAKVINSEILAHSERFLNRISQRIAGDQVAFLNEQVKISTERMERARNAVLEFQAKHKMLDPVVQGEVGTRLVSQLNTDIAIAEAEMRALATFMSEEAPQMVAIKAKLNGLREQAKKEGHQITAGSSGSVNSIAARFQDLRTEAELAVEMHKTILLARENGNIDAIKKSKSLVVISAPNLPQEATMPSRIYWLFLFAAAALFFYGAGKLLWVSVRDHHA